MKKIISIVFILFVLNCRNNEVAAAKQNILDPANPISYSLFKLSSDLIGSSSSSCSSCGAAVSSNQPNSLIGFSDRIIIPSESNSSTNPSVWVLSDGINFTKFTVKIGDCVGAFSSTSSTVCVPRLVGYENGMYAVYGQKVTNSSGQQTIAAEYYGTGSNLNTINLTTTSPGGNANINSTFLYSAGKFHFYGCANNQCALYTTSDGSSWIASVGFSCELIYLADNGSPTCGLSRYFNGSTWVNAGTISGGANSSYSALYIDNIYRAWRNNSGTLSIFNSTSGTITTGITFPGSANSTVSMNGVTNSPSQLAKTSVGVYLMVTSFFSNNVSTFIWLRSSDGNTWTSYNPSIPTDLGTLSNLFGYAALGSSFYTVAQFKSGTNFNNYLLKSSDGLNWTRVTLP